MSVHESLVLRSDHGPVAVLTLNRPERRNALSRALVATLGDLLDELALAPHLRALVLTGAGTVFCAGIDLKEAAGPDTDTNTDEAEGRAVADMQGIADLIGQVHAFPRPTIAVLNGDAMAGGAGLAMACDFALAATGARVGYPEVQRGLVAAIVAHDLVRLVGDRRARELLLTGDPIDAETAERWGLVNRVVPPGRCLEAAIALGRRLVASGPRAVESTKRVLDEAAARPANLRGAAAVSASARVSDEAAEGMRAFLEKRPPRWASEDLGGPPPTDLPASRRR